jgi:Tol biopolymer transport system component
MKRARRAARSIGLGILAVFASLGSLTLTPSPSLAAFPGENSRIVLHGDDGLYTVHPDKTHLRKIEGTTFRDVTPAWSFDGERLVFACRQKDESGEICKMQADGTRRRLVRDLPARNFDPEWSPNGKRIVFTHADEDGPTGIWTMRADGSELRKLTHDKGIEPSWGSSGRIAYAKLLGAQVGVRTIRHDGTHKRLLTDDRDHSPDWSPSGNRVAFTREDQENGGFDLMTIEKDGEDLTRVRSWGSQVAWSPTGRRFVGGVGGQTFLAHRDGSHFRRLTPVDEDFFSPDWRPSP